MRPLMRILFVLGLLILSACGEDEPSPQVNPTAVPATSQNSIASSEAVCPPFVQEALAETDTACQLTGRNQACYGNASVIANLQSPSVDIQFQQPGDIIEVSQIRSLRLDPLDLTSQRWGIALMQLQANLSDTMPGQNVTFLMFGDVQLENRSAQGTTNIGAFYFTSGIGDAACSSAPESGLLIQTPEGIGKVDLKINEIDISIGSTAYLQAQPNAEMIVNVVEGQAEVTSQGVTETVVAGNLTTIALDEDGIAESPPTSPEPYIIQPLQPLPTRNLPRPITIMEQTQTVEFSPVGFEISDSIAEVGEVDVFEFEAVAGQHIYLDSLTETNDLTWSLHYNRPNNATDAQNSETQLSLSTFIADIGKIGLPETGTYQILVYSNNDAIEDYQFRVWDVPEPDVFELRPSDDAPDAVVGSGSGTIETPGVEDIYTFDAEAGQTLYFDGIESSSDIKWNVYGADEDTFNSLDYDVSRDIESFTFATAGRYTIRIWGFQDAVGDYTFQVWDVPTVETLELSLPDDALDGLLGFGEGEIETPGVEDMYNFEVEAGQMLYFDGIESNSNIKWNVYGADEKLNTLDYDVSRDIETLTFETAGTYTVRIWGYEDTVGNYIFQIWDVPSVDMLELFLFDDTQDGVIGIGQGEIETPGVQDEYMLDVEAGQTFYFDGIESDRNIKWNVFNEDDEKLNSLDYDVSRDIETLSFENTGTYTIRIWGHEATIGSYAFQIWDVPPPDEFLLSVSDNVSDVGQGEIETPGVEDRYNFEVEAGRMLYFDGVQSDPNIKWNVFDSEGEKLNGLDFDVNRDIEALTFETAGIYTIRIWGHEDATGSYKFEVRQSE